MSHSGPEAARSVTWTGPESAGAVPGPDCYGQGGTGATVTDANLVLGSLDPANFLGGRRSLDRDGARTVVARLATALGLTAEQDGCRKPRIVNSRMADAVRVATVRRGVDPGGYTLLAFGGATGLHVIAVAAERGIGRIVVPLAASVLSDWGMLNTGLRVELSRSQGQTDSIDTDALQAAFSTMEADGLSRLGWFDTQIMTHRSAAMRNGEPVFEIVVPLDDVDCALGWVVAERFHAVHERLYTYVLRDQQAELVNARLSVIGRLLPVEAQIVEASRTIASPEATRPIYLGGRIRVPVFDFLLLALEQTVDGPALIESDTTTIPLRTGETAQFDPRGWLHVAIDGKPSSA